MWWPLLIDYNMIIQVHHIDLPLPISCDVLTNRSRLMFIWHPLELDVTQKHTAHSKSSESGKHPELSLTADALPGLIERHLKSWFPNNNNTRQPIALLHCSISLSHSFMNSYLMYISQQVSNPGGPGTAVYYSPMTCCPPASTVPLSFNCFSNWTLLSFQ